MVEVSKEVAKVIFVAVGVLLVIAIVMFTCCIAAGKADDLEEQWFREDDKKL